jgi:hypothetical protein
MIYSVICADCETTRCIIAEFQRPEKQEIAFF